MPPHIHGPPPNVGGPFYQQHFPPPPVQSGGPPPPITPRQRQLNEAMQKGDLFVENCTEDGRVCYLDLGFFFTLPHVF